MIISAKEMENNFNKYLKLVENEEIIITANGKKIARLTTYEDDQSIIREGSAAYNHKSPGVTYSEYLEMTENSKERYEYINGQIFLLASPKVKHQRVIRNIFSDFIHWFKDKDCEPFTSPFDVKLKKEENINVVQPDILVVCDQENINEEDTYIGVPALIVEVLSESTKNHDYIRKLDLYRLSGVKEYWIVNYFKEEINLFVFENKDIKEMMTFKDDEIIKSVIFRGLKINLRDIFYISNK